MKKNIIDSIINKTGIPDLVDILVNRLSFGELQSLLMKVYELKSKKIKKADIFREYKTSRFVRPSEINPILHRKLELEVFSLLPSGFEVIGLSPLTPIGTSSVLTPVNQNNVITTIRNQEVAADTTNILALECARRREEILKTDSKSETTIQLCSAQRLTRGQPFENKNFSAHFSVVALCSAGRDEGNDKFELTSLREHIGFYYRLLNEIIDNSQIKEIHIKFFNYNEFENLNLIEYIKKGFIEDGRVIFKVEMNSNFGKNYYHRLRFMIGIINHKNQEFDFIDGGFADWTSQLLNNKKERLLTSGIGTDYLMRAVKLKLIG